VGEEVVATRARSTPHGAVAPWSGPVGLRGFGGSYTQPVDATRGPRDFSDEVASLRGTLGIARAHQVGPSMGGGGANRRSSPGL
jgi:hypothetical protein